MNDLVNSPYFYAIALAVTSLIVLVAERVAPWRKTQKFLRPRLGSDVLHLVFNGHFLGVILYGIFAHRVLPLLNTLLKSVGLEDTLPTNVAVGWPLVLQIVLALLVVDFLQWCVHNLLHRVPLLWRFHQVHHSIQDGEMDWIVSFRFQWTEVVVYKTMLYLPLAFFGFSTKAILFHAVFGTLIGHLNHSNLNITWGPLRYLLNSPRMHIWHHDYDAKGHDTKNYGVIFSCWDWIFGTAYMPEHSPRKLGFHGVETAPATFFSQMAWPLSLSAPVALRSAFGVGLIVAAYLWATPSHKSTTPMLGEKAAASQPSAAKKFKYAESADEAKLNLAAFGKDAEKMGFDDRTSMVSVDELARALGATQLRLIDVRPLERFALGHIPGAQNIDRSSYSQKTPVPGLSLPAVDLGALLQSRGVNEGDTIVLYSDGGPEPYRFWWTLKEIAGLNVRVLDGGLTTWKASGHGLAEGNPLTLSKGNIALKERRKPELGLWEHTQEFAQGALILDTRSKEEFTGEKHHRKAKRAGRIPGAQHVEWFNVFATAEKPTLKTRSELHALFPDLTSESAVLTTCQSGTRSSAVYFALHQMGLRNIQNYDGSWAEYSRLDTPIMKGEGNDAPAPKKVTEEKKDETDGQK